MTSAEASGAKPGGERERRALALRGQALGRDDGAPGFPHQPMPQRAYHVGAGARRQRQPVPVHLALDVQPVAAMGIDVAPRLKTLKVSEPPKRSGGIKVADVAALVAKLKNEAKVI